MTSSKADDEPAKPYHHGALREALLAAAERILARDGVAGLTLRGAAREAGASHAAPKNHFDDLTGLLSELAAIGFDRFSDRMFEAAAKAPAPPLRLNAIGRAYVEFAVAEPGLFQLMFRRERLDASRPALRSAMDRAFGVLLNTVEVAHPDAPPSRTADATRRAYAARAWSMVHGYAFLLLDDQLGPLLDQEPLDADPMSLLDDMLALD